MSLERRVLRLVSVSRLGSFFQSVVELFDFVDGSMLFKELVLFVIEIGHQGQGSLAKAGALHE